MEIKISVIMPVYKVEAYVGKAIESILAQTLQEFEFLIVDDGSPDESGKICDSYAKKDDRIRVIHKENGGAPSARNVAMDCAKGKYLYFMDADDWAENTMLEKMYALAEIHQAQYVVCGYEIDTYYDVEQGKYLSERIQADDAVYETAEAFRREAYRYFDKNMLYTPWNKLYLRSYIEERNLRFPNTLWDDFPFNLSVLCEISRVVVSTESFYHFIRARAESETAAFTPRMYEKREEEHGWLVDLYQRWGVQDAASMEFIARRYVERMVGCVANVTGSKSTLTRREQRQQIKVMLQNPRLKENLALAKPKSRYMKWMLCPMRWQSVWLTWLESKVISYVKEHNTKLFAKLKSGR